MIGASCCEAKFLIVQRWAWSAGRGPRWDTPVRCRAAPHELLTSGPCPHRKIGNNSSLLSHRLVLMIR